MLSTAFIILLTRQVAVVENKVYGVSREIQANDYDLSINKYKEVERERVTYEPVRDILSRLKATESTYLSGYNELTEMLEEGVNE